MPLSLKHPLNPWTYKQSHTPTMVQGGGVMEPPPLGFFAVLQYFGILLKIRNCQKTAEIKIFRCCTCRIWQLNTLRLLVNILCFFHLKRAKKLASKMAWHLLLMTSYLETVATDSHQTCVKCLRGMHTATENGRCRW